MFKRALAVVIGASLLGAGAAGAATVQQVGQSHVGVEAESYDAVSGSGWTTVTPSTSFTSNVGTNILPASTNASDATALWANGGATARYDFVFSTAGTYYVYLRYSMFDRTDSTNYGNEDSVFVTDAFGVAITDTNAQTFDLDAAPSGNPALGAWEGTYRWGQVKGRNATNDARMVTTALTVAPGDLGNTLSLNIKTREWGASIDYVFLSTTNSLSGAAIDAIIPEPASLAVLSLGGLALMRRRR